MDSVSYRSANNNFAALARLIDDVNLNGSNV